MGTRSLTYVFGEFGRPIVCIYRHYDGYPDVHGEDLREMLEGNQIVNGLSLGENRPVFNGMEELAAVLVQQLKSKYIWGNIYLVPPEWPPPDLGQAYDWFVVLGSEGSEPAVFFRTAWEGKIHRFFGSAEDPPFLKGLKGSEP